MSNEALQPILALLGHPVAGNPTQYMVEKALAGLALDWRFLSVDVRPEDLGHAVRGMRAMGFRGGKLTAPHRHTVNEHLDRLGRTAELTRVVNCLTRDGADLVGENTEGKALLEAVRRRIDPAGKRVVLLGAGAMARAIGVELAEAGVQRIVVVNRSEPAGREFVELLGEHWGLDAQFVAWQDEYQTPADVDLLIHATSATAASPAERLPLGLDGLSSQTTVVDVAFNPPDTWLIRQAAERDATVIDGLEVRIEQAVVDIRLWTGVQADRQVIREAVEEFLEL